MNTYSNSVEEFSKRMFIAQSERKFKSMMELVHMKMIEDKNSELKYCANCHEIGDTRAGAIFTLSAKISTPRNKLKVNYAKYFNNFFKVLQWKKRKRIFSLKLKSMVM